MGDPENFSYLATVIVGLDWPDCLMLLLSVFTEVARYLLENMVFVDWATRYSFFSSLTP